MADNYKEELESPEGCQVRMEGKTLTVKGEKGEVSKDFFNPAIDLDVKDNKIIFTARRYTKKSKKLINTFKAHIKNLFKGVTEGHLYKLKICSGHFPMNVSVSGDAFQIKNFIGEKIPRTLKVLEGTSVKVDGSEVIVESSNKEKAGRMASAIEQLTRRPGFDTRIFQDGIYITEKDGKKIK